MNDILIIRNLNTKDIKILERDVDTSYTTKDLLSYGMWCCPSCGKINSIDDSFCASCNEKKFVLLPYHFSKKERLKRLNDKFINYGKEKQRMEMIKFLKGETKGL